MCAFSHQFYLSLRSRTQKTIPLTTSRQSQWEGDRIFTVWKPLPRCDKPRIIYKKGLLSLARTQGLFQSQWWRRHRCYAQKRRDKEKERERGTGEKKNRENPGRVRSVRISVSRRIPPKGNSTFRRPAVFARGGSGERDRNRKRVRSDVCDGQGGMEEVRWYVG